jgi:hypothetical protein
MWWRDPDLGAASPAILVCDPTDEGAGRRDHQVDIESAEGNGFSAYQRTQRDP